MLSIPDPKNEDCNCGHKRTVSNVTNITMVSNDSNPECDCLNMDNFQDSTSGNRFRDLNNIEFSALKSDQPITDAIIKGEPIKTLISFVFFAFSMVTTTLALGMISHKIKAEIKIFGHKEDFKQKFDIFQKIFQRPSKLVYL